MSIQNIVLRILSIIGCFLFALLAVFAIMYDQVEIRRWMIAILSPIPIYAGVKGIFLLLKDMKKD
ncbi:MAG: hypothetical protein COA78_12350 [Blastopirellula sp.]|nr:MAG: hypothetical protein COA78_12350 [Blastopirellula sp.]